MFTDKVHINSILLIILAVFISGSTSLIAQNDSIDSLSATKTKKRQRDFRRIDVFPAISYSPETKVTLGAIGYYYMDLSKGKSETSLSNFNFLVMYTTAKQIAVESKFELFFPEDKWRLRGETFYNHYPDRNYGTGNNANVIIAEDRGGEGIPPDTVNYLSVNTDRLKLAPTFLRKVKKDFYVGLQADIEYIYNYKPLYPYKYISGDTNLIEGLPANGLRSGIGFQLLYDRRDYLVNPIKGYYFEFSNLYYGKATFSDFRFSSYRLDGRAYFNPVLNHTIAIRTVMDIRPGKGPYSLRGYGRVGGKDFVRGYFQGTYQDRTLMGFEVEYRLPLWKEDDDSKLYQIWRRLGIVVFASSAQVANSPGDLRLDEFRNAVGGGLRILFSKESRVNVRIDFAVGLDPDSDGPGKRQTGLYFYLGESF